MSKKTVIAIFVLLAPFGAAAAQTQDLTRHVNPFIGTGGHGHTFPGATVPFGMVQLSPDTRIDNWDGSSGLTTATTRSTGFSHTHLSGTGIPDGCDICSCATGRPGLFNSIEGGAGPEWYKSGFQHSNERAEPGTIRQNSTSGMVCRTYRTDRVGLHRYTFPENGGQHCPHLLWRDKLLGSEIKDSATTESKAFEDQQSWAKDQTVFLWLSFLNRTSVTSPKRRGPDVDTTNSQRIFKFDGKPASRFLSRSPSPTSPSKVPARIWRPSCRIGI